MLSVILLSVSTLIMLSAFLAYTRAYIQKHTARHKRLQLEANALQNQEKTLLDTLHDAEKKVNEYFAFYEVTRKIAPLTNRKELLDACIEQMQHTYPGNVFFEMPPRHISVSTFTLPEPGNKPLYVRSDAAGALEYAPLYISLFSLCLEKINLYEKLQQLAIYDSLTEIYNRRYFNMRFHEECQRSRSFGLAVSLIIIDVDDFKHVNDTYGHLVGDVVLRHIALYIKENIREIDFAARFGGEEFALVLPDTETPGALLTAERIRSKIAAGKIKAFDEIISATVSIGVASFPAHTTQTESLLEKADQALYCAKHKGKNQVCQAEGMEK